MEKRLASLLGPKKNHEKTASLKLVDDFLSDKTGKTTLKAAVDIVKPFFFAICQEKLDEEASKVLSGFNADQGGSREVFPSSQPSNLPSIHRSIVFDCHGATAEHHVDSGPGAQSPMADRIIACVE